VRGVDNQHGAAAQAVNTQSVQDVLGLDVHVGIHLQLPARKIHRQASLSLTPKGLSFLKVSEHHLFFHLDVQRDQTADAVATCRAADQWIHVGYEARLSRYA